MFGLRRSPADKYFSDIVREKADYKCERCFSEFERPTKELHCSHYHSRAKKSVRFDFSNAAALCAKCHYHFDERMRPFEKLDDFVRRRKEHEEFMIKRIGKKEFDLLELRAATPQKVDEKSLVIAFKEQLKRLKENREVLK